MAGSLLFGGLTTASLVAVSALTVGTASASPTTLFSSTTAGSYPVHVPAGVTSVTITAVGGTGGCVANPFQCTDFGGAGAVVTDGAVAVTSGSTLTVTVAQNAGSGAGSGGSGGNASFFPGASGGGASAVYDGLSPLVVAGGGGGGSADGGGAPAGQAGSDAIGCSPGGAGSQTNGGAAGSCDGTEVADNSPAQGGGSGSGGNGGTSTCVPFSRK